MFVYIIFHLNCQAMDPGLWVVQANRHCYPPQVSLSLSPFLWLFCDYRRHSHIQDRGTKQATWAYGRELVQLPDLCIRYIQQRSRVWNFGSSDIPGEPMLLFSDLLCILDTKKTRTHTHNNLTSSRMYCVWQVLTDCSTQQVSIYKRKVRKGSEVRSVNIPHLSHLDTHLPCLYNACCTHPSFHGWCFLVPQYWAACHEWSWGVQLCYRLKKTHLW